MIFMFLGFLFALSCWVLMFQNLFITSSLFFFYKMIDFSKIYCKIHSYEPVNNFCSEKNCLIGLCPTCICQHTTTHMHNHTEPQYENIRNTFTRIQDEIQSQIEVISKDKERLNNLFSNIKEKKDCFKQTLQKAKKDCIQMVNEHFEQLQKRWENEISSEEKKNTLHSNYRLQTLSALISKEQSCLINQISKINTPGFVDEIPRITKEVLTQSRQFHAKIINEIQDNQKYSPIVNYNSQNLKQLSLGLKKLLSLEFFIPFKKYTNSSPSPSQNVSVLLMNKSTMINKSKETEPKRDSINQSVVIRKVSSVQKINNPTFFSHNNSAIFTVPMVLTSSFLSPTMTPKVHDTKNQFALRNQSQILQKSRMSKFNFTPSYIDEVNAAKYTKSDKLENKFHMKPKKSGLSLFSAMNQSQSAASEKQNSRR